ncbi:hypothetical protein EDB83DRAFT_2314606 [Lactarius deliciosus]|nr:hypothetical protein EDB83DRAFT_2314606 [Lactarius deliciosus]
MKKKKKKTTPQSISEGGTTIRLAQWAMCAPIVARGTNDAACSSVAVKEPNCRGRAARVRRLCPTHPGAIRRRGSRYHEAPPPGTSPAIPETEWANAPGRSQSHMLPLGTVGQFSSILNLMGAPSQCIWSGKTKGPQGLPPSHANFPCRLLIPEGRSRPSGDFQHSLILMIPPMAIGPVLVAYGIAKHNGPSTMLSAMSNVELSMDE